MAYIEFSHISKEYHTGETSILALDDAGFEVEKGELAVILGASGAGKTTLAEKLVSYLKNSGLKCELLDGDTVRNIFPQTGFSKKDRD